MKYEDEKGTYTLNEVAALITAGRLKSMTVQAVVIRANGNIEPQGTISGRNRNIFKHLLLQAKIKLTRLWVKYKEMK
jgi:hypothetical protein